MGLIYVSTVYNPNVKNPAFARLTAPYLGQLRLTDPTRLIGWVMSCCPMTASSQTTTERPWQERSGERNIGLHQPKELGKRIGQKNWAKELGKRIGQKNWAKELGSPAQVMIFGDAGLARIPKNHDINTATKNWVVTQR